MRSKTTETGKTIGFSLIIWKNLLPTNARSCPRWIRCPSRFLKHRHGRSNRVLRSRIRSKQRTDTSTSRLRNLGHRLRSFGSCLILNKTMFSARRKKWITRVSLLKLKLLNHSPWESRATIKLQALAYLVTLPLTLKAACIVQSKARDRTNQRLNKNQRGEERNFKPRPRSSSQQ